MTASAIDTVMRDVAAGISRRTSLLTLGGAAFAAAVAKPDVSEAKKKSGNKCKKKEKQRCSNDAATCKATVLTQAICAPGGNPALCVGFQTCCEECSANGYLTCQLALAP